MEYSHTPTVVVLLFEREMLQATETNGIQRISFQFFVLQVYSIISLSSSLLTHSLIAREVVLIKEEDKKARH